MKLIGSLENFQPSSLLQWFQTERAEGVLAVQCRPGCRLRFERGELVAAAHWPPGESLERRLRRWLGEARAAELRLRAKTKGVPLADLLVEVLGADETARLVASHAEEVVFNLLEERTSRFFFDPPACELPGSLRTHLNVSRILLECARRQDEEERLGHWIPSATSPLRLLKDPVAMDDTHSGIRGALVEGLREPRSRQQLEAMIPVESHAVRLKLAELIRSGNVEILPEASVPPGFSESSAASAPSSVLQLAKSPSADDWPFLTLAEARLLEGLGDGPRSLDEAGRTLDQERRELAPVAELLVDTGWVSVRKPAASPVKAGLLAGAALLGGLIVFFLLWPTLARETPPRSGPVAVATEAPRPAPAGAGTGIDEEASEGPAEEVTAAAAFEEAAAGPAVQDPELPKADPEEPAATATPEPVDSEPAVAESPVPASPVPAAPVPEPEEQDRRTRSESVPATAPALPAGRTAAALEPPPAVPSKLMVNAIPYGFVRLNGEEKGATPLNLDLPPGSYEIQVHREGYETVVRTVDLAGDTVFLETFHLERADGEEERP